MNKDNLTPEFLEKAKGKSAEEFISLAESEGVELTDEQLEAVSGGWLGVSCPNCGGDNVSPTNSFTKICHDCGYEW